MHAPKIGIFIPCYNVASSIKAVLAGFSEETLSQIHSILLIDNCSTDGTIATLQSMDPTIPALRKTICVKNGQNYGLGGSQKIAFRYFLENEFDYFMIIHGDNQCDSGAVAADFLKTLKQQPSIDFIMSSRFAKGADVSGYSALRVLGNRFFNLMTCLLTGVPMSDAGAGVVFLRTKALNDVRFEQLDSSFHFNPQLNILLTSRRDVKMAEIPLKWRDSESGSNINALRYCLKLLAILWKYRVAKSILGKTGTDIFNSSAQTFAPQYTVQKLRETV